MKWRNKIFLIIISLSIISTTTPAANADVTIFTCDFETGLCGYTVSNGVWELCLPQTGDPGPQQTPDGFFCAATVCKGNYPANTDSRLISPDIPLSSISGDEEIRLRFWHWFSYSTNDNGYVQISVQDDVTGTWSPWQTISIAVNDTSKVWSPMDIDLSAYADSMIRIAFYHTAAGPYESSGWFIDDISIKIKTPQWTGDFESGWGDWHADKGVWAVGPPTGGPGGPHGGLQSAGTILNGNYPANTNSRLISPSTKLGLIGSDEEIHLRFWHWFSYSTNDNGYVRISAQDDVTGTWSTWQTIGTAVNDTSKVWSPMDIDVSAYADSKIRIAFYHTAAGPYESSGWFIDDIEFVTKVPDLTWDFECGWDDWHTDKGVWEVGTPTSGPGIPYSGMQSAATILNGTYPANTNSRLISPHITLAAGQTYQLTFWHWFSYSTNDQGVVQVSELDQATGTWSAWTTEAGPFAGVSSVWTQIVPVDLTKYAGETIRIAFHHTAAGPYESSGWYIDHIRITGFPHFCECDLNQDTVCDSDDWLKFGEDWGRTDCGTPPGSGKLPNDCGCDLNRDGSCDLYDWLRFGVDWGRTDCLVCP